MKKLTFFFLGRLPVIFLRRSGNFDDYLITIKISKKSPVNNETADMLSDFKQHRRVNSWEYFKALHKHLIKSINQNFIEFFFCFRWVLISSPDEESQSDAVTVEASRYNQGARVTGHLETTDWASRRRRCPTPAKSMVPTEETGISLGSLSFTCCDQRQNH